MSWAVVLGPLLGALLTGVGIKILDWKKTGAETELTDVQRAQITLEMALELQKQKDEFWEIELAFYRERIDVLEQSVKELRSEIIELRKPR